MTEFTFKRRAFLAGATALTATVSLSGAARAQVSFDGQELNFINFGGPGSPPDVWYRTLLPFVQKNLPGNPQINVINKPGASSMIAANFTANAIEADGLNFGSMNGIAMNMAAHGEESARFDLNTLEIIGAQKVTRIMAVKKDGIENFADLMAMEGELVIGMESVATTYYEAFFELTGIESKIISSYQRFPQTLQAFRTGEVDAMPMSVIEWLNFGPDLSEDGAVAMIQYGFDEGGEIVRSDAIADIPTGQEAALQANPDAASSEAWKVLNNQSLTSNVSNQLWAPAGTPREYVDALSAAFEAATQDPEFVELHITQYGLPAEWTNSTDARTIVDAVIANYAS